MDGLLATPIDILHVDARLVFDAADSSGLGQATVNFVIGDHDGSPIFDLRQEITAATLDGSPFPPSKLAHHDFGGGLDAELRVLEAVLPAGSQHTLELQYRLGPPSASPVGSYPPAIAWSGGPRLAFNFGFTDLGAGRYLESFIPANLVFDQFSLTLDLHLLGTNVPHSPITNGVVTVVAPNRWRIDFPAYFTALSPLLELRATDTLEFASDTVDLPVSGKRVAVEAWKLIGSTISLPDRIARPEALADRERAIQRAVPARIPLHRLSAPRRHGVRRRDHERRRSPPPRGVPQLVRSGSQTRQPGRRLVG